MDVNLTNLLAWMVLPGLFLLAVLISSLLFKRAVRQVIGIFRTTRSLCSQRPKTADELGLQPQTLMERLFKPRDYKPYALQALIRAGIVRLTNKGRMCLREEKVSESFGGSITDDHLARNH